MSIQNLKRFSKETKAFVYLEDELLNFDVKFDNDNLVLNEAGETEVDWYNDRDLYLIENNIKDAEFIIKKVSNELSNLYFETVSKLVKYFGIPSYKYVDIFNEVLEMKMVESRLRVCNMLGLHMSFVFVWLQHKNEVPGIYDQYAVDVLEYIKICSDHISSMLAILDPVVSPIKNSINEEADRIRNYTPGYVIHLNIEPKSFMLKLHKKLERYIDDLEDCFKKITSLENKN